MEWALAEDQGIGRQDFTNAIISVARNQEGAYIAWNFLKANWNTIFDRFNECDFYLTLKQSTYT